MAKKIGNLSGIIKKEQNVDDLLYGGGGSMPPVAPVNNNWEEELAKTSEEIGSSIREQDYLDAVDSLLPFSTLLRADVYLKLKRMEYWSRTSIREIIENALVKELEGKLETKKALPVKERNKLKQLKTAGDYLKDRIEKK